MEALFNIENMESCDHGELVVDNCGSISVLNKGNTVTEAWISMTHNRFPEFVEGVQKILSDYNSPSSLSRTENPLLTINVYWYDHGKQ